MRVEQFSLGMLMTNAYLLYDDTERLGIVIDPGDSPNRLIKRIDELGLKIQAILLTHAHFDHIAGLNQVREITQAPVYLHEAETDWLEDPMKNGSGRWQELSPVICEPANVILQGEETLSFVGKKIKVIHTPGHSPGSVTFHIDSEIFSGDVLFAGSVGRTDLPGGDYEQLMTTMKKKVLLMPESTVVRPGHGSETTIGEERRSNPFLFRL